MNNFRSGTMKGLKLLLLASILEAIDEVSKGICNECCSEEHASKICIARCNIFPVLV